MQDMMSPHPAPYAKAIDDCVNCIKGLIAVFYEQMWIEEEAYGLECFLPVIDGSTDVVNALEAVTRCANFYGIYIPGTLTTSLAQIVAWIHSFETKLRGKDVTAYDLGLSGCDLAQVADMFTECATVLQHMRDTAPPANKMRRMD